MASERVKGVKFCAQQSMSIHLYVAENSVNLEKKSNMYDMYRQLPIERNYLGFCIIEHWANYTS